MFQYSSRENIDDASVCSASRSRSAIGRRARSRILSKVSPVALYRVFHTTFPNSRPCVEISRRWVQSISKIRAASTDCRGFRRRSSDAPCRSCAAINCALSTRRVSLTLFRVYHVFRTCPFGGRHAQMVLTQDNKPEM